MSMPAPPSNTPTPAGLATAALLPERSLGTNAARPARISGASVTGTDPGHVAFGNAHDSLARDHAANTPAALPSTRPDAGPAAALPKPAPPGEAGLSAAAAAARAEQRGVFPAVVPRTVYESCFPARAREATRKHVAHLFQGVQSGEREAMVQAVGLLLPPGVDARVYDVVVSYLSTVPATQRAPLSRSAAELGKSLRLATEHDAAGYVDLLKTIYGMPAGSRQDMLRACRIVQPHWKADVAPQAWNPILRAVAAQPPSEVIPFAHEVRELYSGAKRTANGLWNFAECVTQHAALSPAARHALTRLCDGVIAVGPPEAPGTRAQVATLLLHAPADARYARAALLRDVARLGVHMHAFVAEDIIGPLCGPLHRRDERRELVFALSEAFPRGVLVAGAMWPIVRALLEVPRAERHEAIELIALLVERGNVRQATLQTDVIEANPAQRREHIVRLSRTRPAARIGGAEDLENVMQGALQQQVDVAIKALSARFTHPMTFKQTVLGIAAYLRHRYKVTKSVSDDVLQRQRGGATEEHNAVRTLGGPMRDGDFSKSVSETPQMAALCALVWTAASAPRRDVDPKQAARDRDLMRHGVVMALAKCIEDDGHRVCGVGQRQYLVDALKGFYPEAGDAQLSVTPRSLVTVLTADFDRTHGQNAPAPAQVAEFTDRAYRTATERFGAATPEMTEFTEQFDAYMNMTY